MKLHPFQHRLVQENYAVNTVRAYLGALRGFQARYRDLNKQNLLDYRASLIDSYKPKTVNVRIRGINKYLECTGKPELKIKSVKMAEVSFLDNVISNEDYRRFKRKLRREPDQRWYFIVWCLAATGARISELVRFRVEDIRAGYVDICSKGGKIRRLYIPTQLRTEMLRWLDRDSGYLFLNRYGEPLTPRGIAKRLKDFAILYGLDPGVVHPHSFRHLFAKNFLERSSDLALLSDLLGHEGLETTRLYLRKSRQAQNRLVEKIVDW